MAELKLVVSNPPLTQNAQSPLQYKTPKTEFTVEVKNRGPYLYENGYIRAVTLFGMYTHY